MKVPQEFSNAGIWKENELIRQLQQGNPQAFTELVTLYQKKIFKLAFGFFQDRDDAMEIVQETFLRLYQKIDRFDNAGNQTTFKNWIYRIAYNLCVDFYRKFKKQKTDQKDLYEFYENRGKETTNPEDQLDRLYFKQSLKKCVMVLSKRQKTVFMLKHYSGLKHHEISSILNLSVGTIKSLYHRAIKNLEKRLIRLEVTK